MNLLFRIILIVIISVGCSNNQWKSKNSPNDDKGKHAGLEIIMETGNTVTLPQMEGIKVFLWNNSDQIVKIWEPVNPSGILEVCFSFNDGINENLLIKPIILNWRSDFSKVTEIGPGKKQPIDIHITHWECNNMELGKTDFSLEGKLKACYSVTDDFNNGKDLWKGEISSEEVKVILKHKVFAENK